MPDIADDANDLTDLQINTALANREPPAKSLTGCVSGVTKNQSHLIAHIAVKIVAMIMNSIKGRMDRRVKWNIKY
ncbi:hypothetical protein [Proteus mirabilis]|uniref:hypothetical protein n=1 Tax=Proteus mirabilis TaxID=584 RepID=UPI0034D74522